MEWKEREIFLREFFFPHTLFVCLWYVGQERVAGAAVQLQRSQAKPEEMEVKSEPPTRIKMQPNEKSVLRRCCCVMMCVVCCVFCVWDVPHSLFLVQKRLLSGC